MYNDFDHMTLDQFRQEGLKQYGREMPIAAAQDGKSCDCNGRGWINTPFDTWVKCFIHFDGQMHPEEEMYYDDLRYEAEQEAARIAAAQPAQVTCDCGGHGWVLSQYGAWVRCPQHFTGQMHPESADCFNY